MNKALNYIGLAKKAGSVEAGETNSGAAIRAGKGRVLLLASDASDNARSRAENFIFGTKTPLVSLPFSKSDLSQITGEAGCSMVVITDYGFAAAFLQALAEEEPDYKTTAELLTQKNIKAQMRKREALAHEKNLKRGKAASGTATGKRRRNI
ncbi:MAG: 50S ribosomal protein L7 [Oscillospiraceae bacterium]|nr:50S ribosomal protein L7 [Oscillospiraceae bacterium]